MPTVMKASAASTGRVPCTPAGARAMSAMFSVPVIRYSRPMPMTMKVAPIVPMIRYW
jgi:hypothetical protein